MYKSTEKGGPQSKYHSMVRWLELGEGGVEIVGPLKADRKKTEKRKKGHLILYIKYFFIIE